MNFNEAVKAMKEGKKVRRKGWVNNYNPKYIELEHPCIINHMGGEISLNLVHIEATDWEIVDEDADWNLADQEYKKEINIFNGELETLKEILDKRLDDEKKCRDLILDDMVKLDQHKRDHPEEINLLDEWLNLIKKRFGNLK